MLSKGKAKYILSLKDKKVRGKEGLFVVEGEKNILELVRSDFKIKEFYITHALYDKYQKDFDAKSVRIEMIETGEVKTISALETNAVGIALAYQKIHPKVVKVGALQNDEIALMLDDIRDSGNLGTIIRIADWYGVGKIICSEDTVDFYNNKVIASSMGSFTRVTVYYTNLEEFLAKQKKESVSIFGAYLGGKSVHGFKFPTRGLLVMGNEAHGIRKNLAEFVTEKITIPSRGGAESLNVAVATAVILDNWMRK